MSRNRDQRRRYGRAWRQWVAAARDFEREFNVAPTLHYGGSEIADLDFARMARPCCSVCGGPVRWLDPVAAALELPDFMAEMGEVGASGAGPVESVWLCPACGQAGAFFGAEVA